MKIISEFMIPKNSKLLKFFIILFFGVIFLSAANSQVFVAAVEIGDKWGYISSEGNWILEPQFEAAYPFVNRRARVKLNGNFVFIDPKGIIYANPSEYEIYDNFSEGLCPVRSVNTRKWGYIDTNGAWVIQPKYNKAYRFSEELAAVKDGRLWGFIDKKGNMIFDPVFSRIENFSGGFTHVVENGRHYYINKEKRTISFDGIDSHYPFIDGMARLKTDEGILGASNDKGELVIPFKFEYLGDFNEGVTLCRIYGRYGYIRKDGTYLIEPNYDEGKKWQEGIGIVSTNEIWYYIDQEGKLLQPEVRTEVLHYFSEGLAKIEIGDYWGFIDKQMNLVIKPQFLKVRDFHNGIAIVRIDDKWGAINKKGEYILKPDYSHIRYFNPIDSYSEDLMD